MSSTTFPAPRDIVRHLLMQAINSVIPRSLVASRIKFSDSKPHVEAVPIGAMSFGALTGLPPISFGSLTLHPQNVGQICVIGAGKASAAMAEGLEQKLEELGDSGRCLLEKLTGIVNVPDGITSTCRRIEIANVRPQGVNAPTERVLAATRKQLDLIKGYRIPNLLVDLVTKRTSWREAWDLIQLYEHSFTGLGPNDVVIDLISGGGSATRELFRSNITLQDLNLVVEILSKGGATIQQINTVRKCCSQVKGGMMNRWTRAGNVLAWVLSDVLGDPLDSIASGPWAENTTTANNALEILNQHQINTGTVYYHILRMSEREARPIVPGQHVLQEVIGSNAIALATLEAELRRAGHTVLNHGSANKGDARVAGAQLMEKREVQVSAEIYGGETEVTLPKMRIAGSKGGRNQRIVLAALAAAWKCGLGNKIVFSIGTDGEDGPTDAAGAMIDQGILDAAKAAGVSLADVNKALDDCNEYPLLERIGALIITGPTGTNVCDLWGCVNMA